MLYLMSATLVVTTIVSCIIQQLLTRVRKLEKEILESHVTLAKVTRELDKRLSDQMETVHEIAKSASKAVQVHATRVEELGNKLAGLGMKR